MRAGDRGLLVCARSQHVDQPWRRQSSPGAPDVFIDMPARRRILVLTRCDAVVGEEADIDHVTLFVEQRRRLPDGFAERLRVRFPIKGVPQGICSGVEFSDVPAGPARISVRPARGAERYYLVTIGAGTTVPWYANWRYRGCEVYWCGVAE